MYSSNIVFLPLSVFILSMTSGIRGEGNPPFSADAMHSDRIVIKFKDDVVRAEMIPGQLLTLLGPQAQRRGLVRLEKLPLEGVRPARSSRAGARLGYILHGHLSASADRQELLNWLGRHPLVEYAEPLYYHALQVSPNDSLFTSQAYLPVAGLPAAWDVIKGTQGSAIIAIVDGGTEISHPDLLPNLWLNEDEIAGNKLDDDGNGYDDDMHGWNFANNSGDPTGLPSQPDYGNHGTHTAGIADAVTDNIRGISGAAWNCRLMAINAADPFGEGIGYGYEGIIYAVVNEADIINCSWGRVGSPSRYEQDVINYAVSMGAVIVTSAGNSGSTTPSYPACYQNVFTVAATNNYDKKASFSTYGDWIDFSAPGVNILSTISSSDYARYSGTSMSAPLAGGVIALVKSQHPLWSSLQCAEQVRMTCDPLDELNPAYAGLLGKGRINAGRAVTESPPSLRISNVEFSDDGDGQFRPGETVRIYLTLTNYLAPSAAIVLSLVENSAYLAMLNAQVAMPGLGTMESATQTVPFEVVIAEDAPANHVAKFTMTLTAGTYSDTDYFTLTVSPDFLTLNINQIKTSVTPVGRIGFTTPTTASGGTGFSYKSGANLIFEGSIIAGTSAAQISSSSRSTTTTPDQDFVELASDPLTLLRPGPLTDEESTLTMLDQNAGSPMNISLRQHTIASQAVGYADLALFRYEVTNLGSQPLTNFHFGLFFDWDVDEVHYDGDRADYDAGRRLGYVCNIAGEPLTHVGCALLSPGPVSYRAILNDGNAAGNPGWGIYDGFSDEEKWEAISGGVSVTQAGVGDVSQVISAGPFLIEPQGTVTVDFALVAGDDLAGLQAHADKAAEFRKLFLPINPDTALLQLDQGWNLVSSWVAPADSLLDHLLSPLAGNLVLFKDSSGKSYWPASQIDRLSHWDWRKGYWIYLTQAADLALTGRRVTSDDASLTLTQGWNLISYLRESPHAVDEILGSIGDSLIMVKDGKGSVYWPAYGIDTIGMMMPGSGYYLYMNTDVTLEWPSSLP